LESLMFRCPKTHRRVEVGVMTDIATLLRIRSNVLRARCPACADRHDWRVADAFLAEAA